MVFLRAARYYFLLTNHSIHTIKGYRAESYQDLINGLFENLEALDITRVSDFFNLFPLDGAGGFRGYVVNYAVYVFYLVCDTI
jgi:hypothetical protein